MVEALHIETCRNFADQNWSLNQKVFISGPNGSGKSTVLEIIRVLSVGKSFRTSKLDEMIRFKAPYLRIGAKINNGQDVEFFYGSQFGEATDKDRQLIYQGNSITWEEFLGQLPTVLFTPTELNIVLGSPDVRRRYLDSVLWQVDPNYRQNQIDLTQALREKAALLFMVKLNRATPDELTPWNELITNQTKVIRAGRQKYVDYLNNQLAAISQQLSSGERPRKAPLSANTEKPEAESRSPMANVRLKYQFDDRSPEELQTQEIKAAQNLYGPHRDELIIDYNQLSARRFASRGQSRLVVAYLKAAEADYLAAQTGNQVTVLLDDTMSELDATNTQAILNLFKPEHQLILTAAHQVELPKDWQRINLK